MKNKILMLIITIIILTNLVACSNGQTLTFKIYNQSSKQIDKVKISVLGNKSASRYLGKIEVGEQKVLRWDVDGITESDGEYRVEIEMTGELRSGKFGYFTNGYHIDRNYQINVNDKEIEVKYTDD